MNILSYVKTNKLTFDEDPFNRIDAIILTLLSYYDFSDVAASFPMKICDLRGNPYFRTEKAYFDSLLPKSSRSLFLAMMSSPRFRNVTLLAYENRLDKHNAIQFGALAMRFHRRIFIGFKGTDPSYTGWKEDFLLSYRKEIKSYALAQDFVNKVANEFKGKILLGGHSKGGIIAFHCLGHIEDDSRISKAYSFDGPGDREESLFKLHPERKEKALKIVPKDSIVGVIFTNETEIEIVDSNNALFLQHNPFEWKIRDEDFIYLKKRSYSSHYLDKAINGWIKSLSEEERERFAKILFDALDSFQTQDVVTFFKTLPKQFVPVTKSYWALSKEDRRFFNSVFRRLFIRLLPGYEDAIPKEGKLLENR